MRNTIQEPSRSFHATPKARCTGHAMVVLVTNKRAFANAQKQERATRVLASLGHNNTKGASPLH